MLHLSLWYLFSIQRKTNENENGKTKMQMEIGDENGVGDDTSSRRVYFMDRETKWRHFMYLICAAYECVLARVCVYVRACACVCAIGTCINCASSERGTRQRQR